MKRLKERLVTTMKVAVMFSGGKDSIAAVHYAKQQGWDIEALVAIKPRSTEAYLWHYPTVEWTLLQAEAMGIPLILARRSPAPSSTIFFIIPSSGIIGETNTS